MPLTGPGLGISGVGVMPSGKWIVTLVVNAGRGRWQVMDRSGKVSDQVVNSCPCPGRMTNDALWLTRSGNGFESIVRMAVDSATGKLAARQDTLLSGRFNNFSVTADGQTLVIDDPVSEQQLWAVTLPEALADRYPENRRLVQSSTQISAHLSPDGQRVLLSRTLPTSSGGTEERYFLIPFDGGAEAPVNLPRELWSVRWDDNAPPNFSRSRRACAAGVCATEANTAVPGFAIGSEPKWTKGCRGFAERQGGLFFARKTGSTSRFPQRSEKSANG